MVQLALILAAALIGGVLAHHLRQPILLGYLIGGMLIGPFSLGLVEDVGMVRMAAELGVVLLMFALGLEFPLAELRAMGRLGVVGGTVQMLATALLGAGVARLLGASPMEAALLGFLMAMSSTAIVLKTLMERGELDSTHGKIMIALLLFQDLSVVPLMLFLPAVGGPFLPSLGLTVLKASLFLGAILLLGLWGLPRLLARTSRAGSRELFILTLITLSIGAAAGTQLLGLSAAFGAFVGGLLIGRSPFAHQALGDIIPLRDTFAALFFVSLGMLTDPRFILNNWPAVLGISLFIVVSKAIICGGVASSFGYGLRTTLLVGAGMVQIGEFSFVLARAGVQAGILSDYFFNLTLASAFLTILLTDRATRDDKRCRKKYGSSWEEYCRRVPWKIIPGIY